MADKNNKAKANNSGVLVDTRATAKATTKADKPKADAKPKAEKKAKDEKPAPEAKTEKAPKVKAEKPAKEAKPKAEKAPKAEKPKKTPKLADVQTDDTNELTKFPSGKKKAEESAAAKAQREKEAAEKKAAAEKKKADAEARKAELEKKKADPMYRIEARRQKAGGNYLMECSHCGSPDVNANRSPYLAKIIPAGMTDQAQIDKLPEILCKDYRCAECKLYTKTYGETYNGHIAGSPLELNEGDRVKVIRFQPVRAKGNVHRAKGYGVRKALELAGIAQADAQGERLVSDVDLTDSKAVDKFLTEHPENQDEMVGLYWLLSVAVAGDNPELRQKARDVLNKGVTLQFNMPKVETPKAKTTETVTATDSVSVQLNPATTEGEEQVVTSEAEATEAVASDA